MDLLVTSRTKRGWKPRYNQCAGNRNNRIKLRVLYLWSPRLINLAQKPFLGRQFFPIGPSGSLANCF